MRARSFESSSDLSAASGSKTTASPAAATPTSATGPHPSTLPAELQSIKDSLGEGDRHALAGLFSSLSLRRPRPTEEQATQRLQTCCWIVDWALATERLEVAQEKQQALTAKLQKASEDASTSLKNLKFLQNNLYAQQEEVELLREKLAAAELRADTAATAAARSEAATARMADEVATMQRTVRERDEEIERLRHQLEQVKAAPILFVAKEVPVYVQETTRTDCCANCNNLTSLLSSEQQRCRDQIAATEEKLREVERKTTERINTEVERMLQELQRHYRMGLAK
jgi:hypothetical protein